MLAQVLLAAGEFDRAEAQFNALPDTADSSAALGSIALHKGDSAAARRIRKAFRESRARYKRVEGFVEYYAPALAAALNSRRQEVDDDDAPPPSNVTVPPPSMKTARFTE